MASVDSNTPLTSLEIVLETGEDGPGKRRRNRARVSCINCYASKRKCDRKRPCTRCIKLGLTGLCVYEVDDTSMQNKRNIDETSYLKSRIAELESVLRQLKRKPHPQWTTPGGVTHDPDLVAARRRSRRRSHADYIHAASVETPITESAGRETLIKVEEKLSFACKSTAERRCPDLSSQMCTSTPFTFGEDTNCSEASRVFAPLSSFVQTMRGEVKPSPASKPQTHIRISSTEGDDSVLPSTSDNSAAVETTNAGIGTSPVLATSPKGPPTSSSVKQEVCQCLTATTFFNPLLHFAIALQTAREALQGFHASTSDCDLFRRIVELEDQIFSAAPPTTKCAHKLSSSCDGQISCASPSTPPTLGSLPATQSPVEPSIEQRHTSSLAVSSTSTRPSPPSGYQTSACPPSSTNSYALGAFSQQSRNQSHQWI